MKFDKLLKDISETEDRHIMAYKTLIVGLLLASSDCLECMKAQKEVIKDIGNIVEGKA
jgi:hypothetical protein